METSKHHVQDSQRGSFLISSLTLATGDGAAQLRPSLRDLRGGQEVTTRGPLAAQTPRDMVRACIGGQRLGPRMPALSSHAA